MRGGVLCGGVPRRSAYRHDGGQCHVPGPRSAVVCDAMSPLAASAWPPYSLDLPPRAEPYAVTIRFTGRRLGVVGVVQPGDRFVYDETRNGVVGGNGPVSLTVRIHGVNPGDWSVTAQVHNVADPKRKVRTHVKEEVEPSRAFLILTFWRRWAPHADGSESVHTCWQRFGRVPGALPGVWVTCVMPGMVAAVLIQSRVVASSRLALTATLQIFVTAMVAGIIGAKVWFTVLYRSAHRWEGRCIQGFILGATVAAGVSLVRPHHSAGTVLDSLAPGLLLGMAIGRTGCFFAGCCGGPPTAPRWGVWSSDEHIGTRRIPTQLMGSLLALVPGIVAPVVVLVDGPASGAVFAAGLSAYTLVRQRILSLRAEARKDPPWWRGHRSRGGGDTRSQCCADPQVAHAVLEKHTGDGTV